MKDYDSAKIKNVGIYAHSGAGKTTLVEACLYDTGVINRKGRVEDGNTVVDYLPEEIKRGVSINSVVVPLEWKGYQLNIFDTPGYGDFIGEVCSTMRVVDGTIFVLCGVSGVEVQSEIYWQMTQEKQLPTIIFVNKLDRENADYWQVLDQAKAVFGKPALAWNIPVGKEDNFVSVIDLIEGKVCSATGESQEIPEKLAEQVGRLREELIEAAVEFDEEVMMKYLEGEEISLAEIKQGLTVGIRQGKIIPVLAGSVIKGVGLKQLLDVVATHLPATDVLEPPSPEFAGLVFKTTSDAYVGKLSYLRVYGGTVKNGEQVWNQNKGQLEKIGQILRVRGKEQWPVTQANRGEIVAIPKLQVTTTGDTLCQKDQPVQLAGIQFPKPNLAIAVVPKSKGDEDKLGAAVSRLLEEDSTIQIIKETQTKEMLLWGMGETHLEVLLERLQGKFGVEIVGSVPKVPYRETIRASAQVEGKHKKQSGGHGQYGHVWLEVGPSYDQELDFSEKIFGGAVPKQYIPAVEKGVREAMQEGVLAGYPLTKIKVVLYDGSYHSVDSSELAFKIAASQALKKAVQKAQPILLEPIMKVEIKVPEAYMGDILSDLNGKRGRILGMEPQEGYQVIRAQVPLAEMRRYAVDLKSMTQGRGIFQMEIEGYQDVPPKLTEEIIAQSQAEK